VPIKKQEKPSVKERILALFTKKNKPETKMDLQPALANPTEQPIASAKRELSETKRRTTTDSIVTPVAKQEINSSAKDQPPVKPETKDAFILPTALKPDDVKIEDAHTPEGEVAVNSKNSLAMFVEKYGDASAQDLQFRVQISAFKYRNRYVFPHLANLGAIENTLTEGGITRITIGGQFDTYKKALEHNKKVIAAGQKDAFVTAFYKGKRVYVENLEKMGIFVTK
jgi:hypothetical protein